jgi:1-acyl-sn-glycerol-3-phosphate acyltransferase
MQRAKFRRMSVPDQVGRVAALAARTFYRLELDGERPAAEGPLLVVANHPNSLLDPALVTLAIGRTARFLAKAPLFTDRSVGWLVRASGAIPVHRRQDGDVPAGGNDDTFRAAEESLLAGDAIALFPEGISHALPALAPLKTGAARLALQTAARLGGPFAIVPVGITLDDRAIFRSRGLLVVGEAVAWDDLAHEAVADTRRGESATAAPRVRELTARIERAIAGVTVSYASWDDAQLVALADEVHHAAVAEDAALDAGDRLDRRRLGAVLLARIHGDDAPETVALRDEAAALGTVLGWVPYQLTGRVALLFPGADAIDVRATAKALVGMVAFLLWTVLLAVVAGLLVGWWAALLTLVVVPPLLLHALVTREGWSEALRDARRFLTLRSRAARVAELRKRQAELARRIEGFVERAEAVR